MDTSKQDATEKLTQEILVHATGPMLAAGMSEGAVVRMCEQVSETYHRRLIDRYVEFGFCAKTFASACVYRTEDSSAGTICVHCGKPKP